MVPQRRRSQLVVVRLRTGLKELSMVLPRLAPCLLQLVHGREDCHVSSRANGSRHRRHAKRRDFINMTIENLKFIYTYTPVIRSDMKIALAWGSGRRGSLLSSGGWLLVLLE